MPGQAAAIQPLRSVSLQPVSIVIPTRNRPALLSNCLQSLSELQGVPYEIIVVDNASGPETAQTAGEYPVRLVREEQLGLSRARNRGLAEARGDIVAFLDDDVVVDRGWLVSLAAAFGDPTLACVLGPVLPLELRTPAQRLFEGTGGLGRGFERRLYHKSLPATPQADIGVGANMAFRREVLLTHSAFCEALDVGTPAHAGGDIDMFYRLLRTGETILYEPAMLVWHRHRETLSSLRLSRYCYSVGAAAAFSRWALGGDLRALWLGLRWFARQHVRELVTSLLGLHPLPPHIVASGLLGALLGPLAYLRGSWRIRYRAPVEIAPQETRVAGAEQWRCANTCTGSKA
jgi:glycosyltransferase involved in cell wall biosynthesis